MLTQEQLEYCRDNYDATLVSAFENMPDDEKNSWYKLTVAWSDGDESSAKIIKEAFPNSFDKLGTMGLMHQLFQLTYDAVPESERESDYHRSDRNLDLIYYGGTPIPKQLAPLLKLRIAAGLTQKQLSEKSGVSVGQISRIERGYIVSGNMTLSNAAALANALNCHAEDLL